MSGMVMTTKWSEQSCLGSLSKSPMASVVMLVYNHADYLDEAIRSILDQHTSFDFEILVGEDCSTDESRKIAKDYQRLYPSIIRVLEPSHNVGMGQNAEKLILESRGKYIVFCEGDDYWLDPLKLQTQVDFLELNIDYSAVHTSFLVTQYRYSKWRLSKKDGKEDASSVPSGYVFESLLRGNFIQTCTFCGRSDVAKAAMMSRLEFLSYPVIDWPLFLFHAAKGKIAYLDTYSAVYRRAPGSALNSGSASTLAISMNCLPMLHEIFDFFEVNNAKKNSALSSLHVTILSQALVSGNRGVFWESWSWLERNDHLLLEKFPRRIMPFLMRYEFVRKRLIGLISVRNYLADLLIFRKPASVSYLKSQSKAKNF